MGLLDLESAVGAAVLEAPLLFSCFSIVFFVFFLCCYAAVFLPLH